MVKHHLLHLHALDGRQLVGQFVTQAFVADHLQQDQPAGGEQRFSSTMV